MSSGKVVGWLRNKLMPVFDAFCTSESHSVTSPPMNPLHHSSNTTVRLEIVHVSLKLFSSAHLVNHGGRLSSAVCQAGFLFRSIAGQKPGKHMATCGPLIARSSRHPGQSQRVTPSSARQVWQYFRSSQGFPCSIFTQMKPQHLPSRPVPCVTVCDVWDV